MTLIMTFRRLFNKSLERLVDSNVKDLDISSAIAKYKKTDAVHLLELKFYAFCHMSAESVQSYQSRFFVASRIHCVAGL